MLLTINALLFLHPGHLNAGRGKPGGGVVDAHGVVAQPRQQGLDPVGQAGQVAPVDKMSVVFVAIIGALFLGERLSVMGWSGVALIAGGAVLVAVG